ncbi:MAG: T9SS type A sorting domain-containing protein, partial [bacterium]
YGARVGSDGSVRDPAGIAISAAAGAQECPDVACDGTGYLVVWQDNRGGAYDIYAARVDSAGAVLDGSGFVISGAASDQTHPAVAFDGTDYLVVWQDLRGGVACDVYGTRVSAGGTVLDPAGIAISTATGAQEYPAAVFNGAGYLVVWQDRRGGPYADIYAARLATDGTVRDPAGLAVSAASYDQLYPTLAFEGTYWVVAWQDMRRLATRPDIFAARVDTTGVVLDATGFVVSNESYNQLAPAAASGIPGQTVIAYSSFTHAPDYGSSRIWANSYGTASGVPWDGLPGEPAKRLVITPNPAIGRVAFEVRLEPGEAASLKIFDVEGRLVATLLDKAGPAEDMRSVEIESDITAPGIYFCRLEHSGRTEVRKLVVLR